MSSHSKLLFLPLVFALACGESDDNLEDNEQPGAQEPDSGIKPAKDHPKFTSVLGEAISAPVADECITNVGAGDHVFTCEGITYYVLVDAECTKRQCGVIFDVHGATMSGLQQRDNTLLHETAPGAGYIYVNPSKTANPTGGTWSLTADPPKIAVVLKKVVAAFHANPKRVHVTGFSQGGFTTFYIARYNSDILASVAPVAGALEQPTWADATWKPRVPMLVMNGITDVASTIEASRQLTQTLVTGLSLTGGDQVAGDGHWTQKRWTGEGGMVLDYIEHDYGGQALLAGHCIPGGIDVAGAPHSTPLNATTCTTGDLKLNWGDYVLQWFIDHPKP